MENVLFTSFGLFLTLLLKQTKKRRKFKISQQFELTLNCRDVEQGQEKKRKTKRKKQHKIEDEDTR